MYAGIDCQNHFNEISSLESCEISIYSIDALRRKVIAKVIKVHVNFCVKTCANIIGEICYGNRNINYL